jgi:hypothetical protein
VPAGRRPGVCVFFCFVCVRAPRGGSSRDVGVAGWQAGRVDADRAADVLLREAFLRCVRRARAPAVRVCCVCVLCLCFLFSGLRPGSTSADACVRKRLRRHMCVRVRGGGAESNPSFVEHLTAEKVGIESLCMHLPRHGDSIIVCGAVGSQLAELQTAFDRLNAPPPPPSLHALSWLPCSVPALTPAAAVAAAACVGTASPREPGVSILESVHFD